MRAPLPPRYSRSGVLLRANNHHHGKIRMNGRGPCTNTGGRCIMIMRGGANPYAGSRPTSATGRRMITYGGGPYAGGIAPTVTNGGGPGIMAMNGSGPGMNGADPCTGPCIGGAACSPCSSGAPSAVAGGSGASGASAPRGACGAGNRYAGGDPLKSRSEFFHP